MSSKTRGLCEEGKGERGETEKRHNNKSPGRDSFFSSLPLLFQSEVSCFHPLLLPHGHSRQALGKLSENAATGVACHARPWHPAPLIPDPYSLAPILCRGRLEQPWVGFYTGGAPALLSQPQAGSPRSVSEPTTHERREVYYRGCVQGVGFRYTVRRAAARFPVVGYVRNLGDGRVHVVVEGRPADVERLLDAVTAEMRHYIEGTEQTAGEATGEFDRFEIRF
ncbi:MAG: acylphosphatase [Pirellulales bacterium]